MATTSVIGEGADASAPTFPQDIIADGRRDIASRMDLAKMYVEAPGRRTFDRNLYEWTTSNYNGTKIVEDKYDVAKHGPLTDKWVECPVSPSALERVEHEDTRKCVEVGLIDGADLEIMKNSREEEEAEKKDEKVSEKKAGKRKESSNSSRNKQMEDLRRRSEPLDRPPTALRVFAKCTQTISSQTKFFAGCMMIGGRLQLKKVGAPYVFFYPEFWKDMPPKSKESVTTRQKFITPFCGRVAAEEQIQESRAMPTITTDEASKLTSFNPIAATAAESLASNVSLQYSVALLSGESDRYDVAIGLLEHCVGDLNLRDGPKVPNDGQNAFFTFHQALTEEEANQLSEELKTAHQHMPKIEPDLILAVHACLRDNEELQDRLPQGLLPFFLDNAQLKLGDNYERVRLARALPKLIETTEVHGRHLQVWTPSNIALTDKHLHRIIAASHDLLEKTAKKLYDDGVAIIQQFGASRKYDSITDLMRKASKAIDVKTQEMYLHQMAAVIAGQYGVNFRDVAETMRAHANAMSRVLKHLGPVDGGDEGDDDEGAGMEE